MFKIIRYGFSWLLDDLKDILNIKYQKPIKNINFPITDNCNSKCVMCNVWLEKSYNEFTSEEIGRIFEDEGLASVEHVGISGGEPSLRSDLVDCIYSMIAGLKKIKSLSITSHGYHFNRWSRFLPRIKRACFDADVRFTLNLSMDGVGDEHDKVRGIHGAFGRLERTIDIAIDQEVTVQLQCTVSNINAYAVIDVLLYAIDKKVDVIFRLATEIERLSNQALTKDYQLDIDQKSYLSDFFGSEFLYDNTKSIARKLYYKKISDWLITGGNRSFPCYFQKEGVLITAKGDVYNCSVSGTKLGSIIASDSTDRAFLYSEKSQMARASVIRDVCPSCIHDQSGAWSPLVLVSTLVSNHKKIRLILSFVSKLAKALKYFFQIILAKIIRTLKLKRQVFLEGGQVCIIGAYGGEHVGDAAILGGVILRAIKKYSVSDVVVLSIRPDRTERWVRALNLPLPINVINYNDDSSVRNVLKESSMLIYGGGPLMELPLHLLKHLRTVIWSRYTFGIPFYLEGVGIGPLRSWVSKALVRQLFVESSGSVVRTADAKANLSLLSIESKDVDVSQDPAFDYLYFKPDKKQPLKFREAQFVTSIPSLSTVIKIGINLRPLWEKYSSDSSIDLVVVEANMLEAIVNCIQHLNREGFKCEVYYFAMNSDVYGFSDFIPAHKLRILLSTIGQKMNIWHEEAGVEGMIGFLKKMSVVISMRFHGCIFALSQNKSNVVGIDYQVGSKGKVSELYRDNGLCNNLVSVQSCSSEKLIFMVKKIIENEDVTSNRIPSKQI